MVELNLLPWREKQRKLQRQQFCITLIGMIFFGLLIVVIMHCYISNKIQYQDAANRYLQTEIKILSQQADTNNELEVHRESLIKKMDWIYALQASRLNIVNIFNALVRIIPPGISIRQIQREGTSLILEGDAESNARIAALMASAEGSKVFSEPELQQIKSDSTGRDPLQEFRLSLRLANDS